MRFRVDEMPLLRYDCPFCDYMGDPDEPICKCDEQCCEYFMNGGQYPEDCRWLIDEERENELKLILVKPER